MRVVGEAVEEPRAGGKAAEEMPMGGVWIVGAVETVKSGKTGGTQGCRGACGCGGKFGRRGQGARRWAAQGPVNDQGEGPEGATLMDVMPKKIQISNRFRDFRE